MDCNSCSQRTINCLASQGVETSAHGETFTEVGELLNRRPGCANDGQFDSKSVEDPVEPMCRRNTAVPHLVAGLAALHGTAEDF